MKESKKTVRDNNYRHLQRLIRNAEFYRVKGGEEGLAQALEEIRVFKANCKVEGL